ADGFCGFYETVENDDVAAALLSAARVWLTGRGLTGMRGPTNPSMNDTSGLLTQGFDREPSILMPYNPPYYEDYLLRFGFKRAMTMWAYYIHKKYVKLDTLRRGVELVQRRNRTIRLRPPDMSSYGEQARSIRQVKDDAWSSD